MTTAHYVPRPSNTKGVTSYSDVTTCSWTTWLGTPLQATSTKTDSTQSRQYGFVGTPTNGQVVNGFRMPTPWFMVADRMTGHPCDYVSKDPSLGIYGKYAKRGNSLAYNPCALLGLRPWNATSRTVSLPWGLSNRSNVEALNKIKSQKVDLSVLFGEANTTLAMLGKSLSELAAVVRDARKGRWDRLRKRFGTKKGVGDTWLEYQYGWLPLLSDIYGIQEQLKEGFRKEGFLIRASATATEQWHPTEVLPKNNLVATRDYSVKGKSYYRSKTVYYCKISDQELYALNQLGLTNPLLLAWELTTLSFVVDWVLPIGDLLGSLTATLGTTFVAGFEDRIAYADVEATGQYHTYLWGTRDRIQRRVHAFERRILPMFEPPGFYIGSGLNLRRAFSALALLQQMR